MTGSNDLHQYNLDYLAAQHAQNLVDRLKESAKETENTITKTLGVLQENGVYACFLYLYAREDQGKAIAEKMLALLQALDFPKPEEDDDVLKYIADKITADLHRLLLAKEALEQMLIYARYGAKARQKG